METGEVLLSIVLFLLWRMEVGDLDSLGRLKGGVAPPPLLRLEVSSKIPRKAADEFLDMLNTTRNLVG